MDRVYVLIMAAGKGLRFNDPLPKQYLLCGGTSILRQTILTFLKLFKAEQIRVVIQESDIALYRHATQGLDLPPPIIGGSERVFSVKCGLDNLQHCNPDKILIHDAVRPFVSVELIARVVAELSEHDAVVPILPVKDTLKQLGNDMFIASTQDRNNFCLAQTPQGFKFKELYQAYTTADLSSVTDDSQVFENTGRNVKTIIGEEINFKITMRADLLRGEQMLHSSYEMRIGSGFDAHRFKPHPAGATTIMLCGVSIPCKMGLEAHSDGDIAIHALVDALLGCIACGDIGMHFPPSDSKWKNVSSSVFLEATLAMVAAKNGQIINIDITIIGEKPRIGKYRTEMQEKLSDILAISADRVNVKATTTEKMGFTGREEGIAAHAIASIRLFNR